METGIKIGASKEAVDAAKDGFLKLIDKAYQTRMEQETIRVLLGEFGRACAVSGVNIQNCTFLSGKQGSPKESNK